MVSSQRAQTHIDREACTHTLAAMIIILMSRGHEVSPYPLAYLQKLVCPHRLLEPDSLTFSTAVSHRSTYNRREREIEGERERETWGEEREAE